MTGNINLNGMVDNEIDRHKRVDLSGVTSKAVHGLSHGGKIYHCGYTCEVLEDNTGWAEGDFFVILRALNPVKDLLDISFFDVEVVAVAHGTFEKNSDGVRKALDAGVVESGQLVIVEVLALM